MLLNSELLAVYSLVYAETFSLNDSLSILETDSERESESAYTAIYNPFSVHRPVVLGKQYLAMICWLGTISHGFLVNFTTDTTIYMLLRMLGYIYIFFTR